MAYSDPAPAGGPGAAGCLRDVAAIEDRGYRKILAAAEKGSAIAPELTGLAFDGADRLLG
jgi:hypothetical protein